MGWATPYIDKLRNGETVSFRPRGSSMSPRIESGQLCTVEPVEGVEIRVGYVVLCTVEGRQYLHLVKAIRGPRGDQRYQIGNNRGGINGWVGKKCIFGRLVCVVP